ncbi:chemotaxis protein CheW [Methanoculleus sp. Wushi-C6]|uniref:Chemotaxis protein CheW n=1 Tax=Methanoculleus caldifontis TaxID=2651577 RepID=A0ABU3WZJ9_9EURY|nr:chemotaxis protein CheW [Methanoculleus sp. Wushi-C6]MDV2481223.1 chemotaxis protein CheW [Methanoculleus sp. Wushi-C6]
MSRPDLLSFTVAGVTCALPLAAVRQVTSMVALSPAGTMNLHGRAVPVYSARTLLGLPEKPPHPSEVLIVVRPGPDCAAVRVDGVRGVRENTAPPGESGVLLGEDGTVLIRDLPLFLEGGAAGRLPLTPTGEEALPETGRAASILAERAEALAQPEEEPHQTALSEILTFRIADREYAVETRYVREVFIVREITPVPGVPDFIVGISAERGEIVSIVDLARLFSLPGRGLTELNRVIVLSDGAMTFGILADYITDIGTTPTGDLAPVKPGATPIAGRYLLGAADGSRIVLDAAAILADPAMVICQTSR